MKRYGLIVCFLIFFLSSFSQSGRTTKNNYTGDWETPESWDPTWAIPQTTIDGYNININGFISCNATLTLSGTSDTLFINDTLVLYSDLTLGNTCVLIVNSNAILIIHGNLNGGNKTTIQSNASIVVTGNFTKLGVGNNGSFVSYETPSNVFIGGTVQEGLDTVFFPVFNCPGSSPYDSSECSYGNMQDLKNDPIYPFYLSTCSTATPTITASGPLTFCNGDSVTLTSGTGTNYLWSTGDTTKSILITTAGSYTVSVTNSSGCQSAVSAETIVTVNSLPTPIITITDNSGLVSNDGIVCEGATATLIASGGTVYSWSSGETSAEITKNTAGTYTVSVTDANGCQDSEDTIITLNSLPIPLITITDNSGLVSNDGIVCEGATATLTASGGTVYSWSSGETTAEITKNTAGTYTVTVTDGNNCKNTTDDSITITATPMANAGLDQELNSVTSTTMQAEILSPVTGEWSLIAGSGIINDINSPTTVVSDLSTGENFFLWTVSSDGCSASDTMIIRVSDLILPQVITPNGDGKNDFFFIRDIEKNSPAELIIFNRWGNEVYQNANYLNDWGGRSNNGSELSNDTYFYILRLADKRTSKGFVVIKK